MVAAGQVLRIPSNVPHRAVALEDTLDLDIFSPIRHDWLTKDDAYLRGNPHGPGLKDRVALVAASSQGLGKAVALGLAREGANLALCARNEATLQATADRDPPRDRGRRVDRAPSM